MSKREKFETVPIPRYVPSWVAEYKALAAATGRGRGLRLALKGQHRGTILNALRRLHSQSNRAKSHCVASQRDGDEHIIVWLMKEATK